MMQVNVLRSEHPRFICAYAAAVQQPEEHGDSDPLGALFKRYAYGRQAVTSHEEMG
jgi:hypothetical protein